MSANFTQNELGDIEFFNTLGQMLSSIWPLQIVLDAGNTGMTWQGVSSLVGNRTQRMQQISEIYNDEPGCGAAIDDLLARGELICQVDKVIQQREGAGVRLIGASFDELCLTPDQPDAVAKHVSSELPANSIWTRLKTSLALIDYRSVPESHETAAVELRR